MMDLRFPKASDKCKPRFNVGVSGESFLNSVRDIINNCWVQVILVVYIKTRWYFCMRTVKKGGNTIGEWFINLIVSKVEDFATNMVDSNISRVPCINFRQRIGW